MKKFTTHEGIAAPLLRLNVDTDAIIPSREMKAVSKRGLGVGLFAGWRYLSPESRDPDPAFVLNKPQYQGASILLAGINFGCGSSREHAVWALVEYGIRAIIAPSFGSIFFNNCVRNGLLPVILNDGIIRELAALVEDDPQQYKITIDLVNRKLIAPNGQQHDFEIADGQREMLIQGLDPIALTMQLDQQIRVFQAQDRIDRPWIYFAEEGAEQG